MERKLKVVAISDTHMLHRALDGRLPTGDVLIHAGDCLNYGKMSEVTGFSTWWNALKYEHKILVPGNHDRAFENVEYEARGMFGPDTHVLIDEGLEIEGRAFWGTPWQPEFNNWAFNANPDVRREKYSKIPDKLDVLVSHAPPYGFRDRVYTDFLGDEELALKTSGSWYLPKVHVCGHIHYGYGIERREVVEYTGIVINAAICNEGYKPVNAPVVFYV